MRALAHALFASLLALALPAASSAQGFEFPGFAKREIATNGATIHVRSGGAGPAVVLLHGYGETGDMWVPLAADLARDHTVIVPDLRGLGLSSKPAGGFDKKTQAEDVEGVLVALGVQRADVVAHDIGNMVAFQFAARYPERVRRMVLIDAPVPGVGPWEEILKNPLLWHFRFGGPGHGAARRRARADLPRPVLERVLRHARRASAKPRGVTTRSSTPCPARCIPASRSSPRSTRTRSTTAPSSPPAAD